MNKRNNIKGITLVTLVITIVILVILATVSINLVFGNDGIINNSKKVAEEYKQAVEYEHKTLDKLEWEYNQSILGNIDSLNESGIYNFSIEGIKYEIHLYYIDGDTIWDTNQIFGNSEDIGTSDSDATRMVFVKVNGDLTINSGVTISPYYSAYGGPKGFGLYCTGNIINNGIIENNHGAKADGEDIYLWKNNDNKFEYIPKVGATGGRAGTGHGTGASGYNGSNRTTGGGAAGGGYYYNDSAGNGGAGGNGTSYSGGTGGGGAYRYGTAGYGSNKGGTGGNALGQWSNSEGSGGGAGNPGGTSTGGGTAGGNGTRWITYNIWKYSFK